jgi:hypothetical protein
VESHLVRVALDWPTHSGRQLPLPILTLARFKSSIPSIDLSIEQPFTLPHHGFVGVCCQVYHEATVAEELVRSTGRMVQRCRRLQTAWIEVGFHLNGRFGHPQLISICNADTFDAIRADDLIPEENDVVQLALKRLPPKEAYDRVFRMRRAFQVCFQRLNTL